MSTGKLWFQIEDSNTKKINLPQGNELILLRRAIRQNSGLSEPADSLTLHVKRENDIQYNILDDDLFNNTCGKRFDLLIDNFSITWNNPLLVTLPQEETATKVSTSKASTSKGKVGISSSKVITSKARTTEIQVQEPEPPKKIWIRYGDIYISLLQKRDLEGIDDVDELKRIIKSQFNTELNDVSLKNITLCSNEITLGGNTPISGLYNNNKQHALEVVVDELTGKMSNLAIEEPEFKYASAAFECDFKDRSNYVGNFQNYITLCHNSSKDTYMPYLSIVQSSGYGKSRLIKEYAKQVYTLYLNLGINRKCFPLPSSCAEDFINSFQKTTSPETWFNTFLAKAVSLVVSKAKNNTSRSSFWASHLNDDGKSIWEPAIEAANSMNKTNKELMPVRDNPDYLEQNLAINDEDIKILLCIDEGRTLVQEKNRFLNISLFQCWRRALRKNKWRAKGLFSVILDTSPSGYDPTLKFIQDDKKLFKPFIYISTYNSLENDTGNFHSQAFSIGRPCWKALRDVYLKEVYGSNDSSAWDKVKSLVKAKLQGGTNNPPDNEGKILTSIAVLASLCSVDISPSVHFASKLVASHLGTCLSISQDRTKILVCYPTEPLVTEAAYELLDDNMLYLTAQSFSQGIVEPGKRSEIVGELILILTRQKLCKRLIKTKHAKFFTGEINLITFLNDLLVSDSVVLKKNCDEQQFFKDANISFTRFVTIRTIPTFEDVKNGYKCCVAFKLKQNQQGADFLIPVKYNNKYNNEIYTIWIIQIKNHNLPRFNSNVKEDSTFKLEPKYVFSKTDLANFHAPYLAMYWQLGAYETDIQEGIPNSTRGRVGKPTTHYIILGLKSFKIARENTLKGLRAILEAYINPYDKFCSFDEFLGDQTTFNETFLPWHPSNDKILLLDEYDDDDDDIQDYQII